MTTSQVCRQASWLHVSQHAHGSTPPTQGWPARLLWLGQRNSPAHEGQLAGLLGSLTALWRISNCTSAAHA